MHALEKAWDLSCPVSQVLPSTPELGIHGRCPKMPWGLQASSRDCCLPWPPGGLRNPLLRAWEKEVGAQGIWIWMSQLLSSSAPTGWKVLRIQGDETQVFNKCRWMWYSFNISCMRAKSLWSCLTLWESSWTRARQAPLSMGISRQEYWRGLLALLRGIWPTQGSNPHLPCLLHWQANSLPLSHLGSPIFTAYPCGLSVISSAFWFLTCVRSISETAH